MLVVQSLNMIRSSFVSDSQTLNIDHERKKSMLKDFVEMSTITKNGHKWSSESETYDVESQLTFKNDLVLSESFTLESTQATNSLKSLEENTLAKVKLEEQGISYTDSHQTIISRNMEEYVFEEVDSDNIIAKWNFLDTFGQLPDIDEISETLPEVWPKLKKYRPKGTDDSQSEFRSTLDISSEGSSIMSISSKEFEPESQLMNEHESYSGGYLGESDSNASTDLLSIASTSIFSTSEPSEKVVSFRKSVNDEMFHQLVDTAPLSASQLDNIDYNDDVRQLVTEATNEFLIDLINKTVEYCELTEVQLPRFINKKMLRAELIATFEMYQNEYYTNKYLNKRMVEFYLRKRIFYPIIPTKNEVDYKKRFESALFQIDHMIERQKQTEELSKLVINALIEEEIVTRRQVEAKSYELENLIRNTIGARTELNKVNAVVTEILNKMIKMRNDISEVRLELILKQHDYADMKAKLEKFQHIGNGLTLRQYETTQREIEAMSKKLEERNLEMIRLHDKVTSELHLYAHLKSKRQMVNKLLATGHDILNDKRIMQRQLREAIHLGNLENNKLCKEFMALKTDGSLIHFPSLMKDFDNTMIIVLQKRKAVQDLRLEHDNLIWRIEQLENKFDGNRDGGFSKSESRSIYPQTKYQAGTSKLSALMSKNTSSTYFLRQISSRKKSSSDAADRDSSKRNERRNTTRLSLWKRAHVREATEISHSVRSTL